MPSSSTEGRPRRIDTVDILRGLVMVLMVLDHIRDFTERSAFLYDATDLAHTTVPLFVTRWAAHLCAPTFVFLAGTGAYLQLIRGKSRPELAQFLATRGLWLIFLEFTVVHVGIGLSYDPTFAGMAQVIWAIGVAMIVLAALLWLPTWAIGAFGLLMIAIHNAFDGVMIARWGPGAPMPSLATWVGTILHQPGMLPLSPSGTPMVFIGYPLIPWIGVMAVGFAFGAIYRREAAERAALIAKIGVAALVAFVVLRTLNVYGDPVPWSHQSSAELTVLSFFRVQKYPPSLQFLCATLGVSFLLLAWFERRAMRGASSWIERTLLTFGRVPLFFYILQWYVAHGLAVVALAVTGQDYHVSLHHPIVAPRPPAGFGFSLSTVYLFWLMSLAILYLPCRWFAGIKARRRDWWLSYL